MRSGFAFQRAIFSPVFRGKTLSQFPFLLSFRDVLLQAFLFPIAPTLPAVFVLAAPFSGVMLRFKDFFLVRFLKARFSFFPLP